MNKKICAIVVTYNREKLMKKCIGKLIENSDDLDKIIVVNNASTDGTKEFLNKIDNSKLHIINLEKNLGGAGGFTKGIEYAYNHGFDYFWIMDDDTMVNESTLKYLLDGFRNGDKVGFVCSNVLFTDKSQCVMNIPKISKRWGEQLIKNLLKVESASFVSILICREVVEKLGLPIREFFIWGDDLEYTQRITSEYNGYMNIKSTVIHEMNSNIGIDIVSDNSDRINRYYYEYRNKMFIYKRNKKIAKYIGYVLKTIIKIIILNNENKIKKIKIVSSGVKDGLFFNPTIKFAK